MISLNIFTKCPSTGEPKSRMKGLLDEHGRCNLAKVMLDFILLEFRITPSQSKIKVLYLFKFNLIKIFLYFF